MPIVLVTTPPQPASKARRMLLSDSVGGADESRNGFSKRIPVNVTERSTPIVPPRRAPRESETTENSRSEGRIAESAGRGSRGRSLRGLRRQAGRFAGRVQVERFGLDAVDVAQAVAGRAHAREQLVEAQGAIRRKVVRGAVAGEEQEAAVRARPWPEIPGGRVDLGPEVARRAPALAAAVADVEIVGAERVRAAVRGEEQQAPVGRDPGSMSWPALLSTGPRFSGAEKRPAWSRARRDRSCRLVPGFPRPAPSRSRASRPPSCSGTTRIRRSTAPEHARALPTRPRRAGDARCRCPPWPRLPPRRDASRRSRRSPRPVRRRDRPRPIAPRRAPPGAGPMPGRSTPRRRSSNDGSRECSSGSRPAGRQQRR